MRFDVRLIIIIIPLLHFCTSTNQNKKTTNSEDTFIPTHEWQIVQKGKKFYAIFKNSLILLLF